MTTHAQMFVNLPVKNLDRSVAFFTQVGYSFNPQFTDENATCMILGENLFVMLLVEPFFQTFTSKSLCDTGKSVESLVALPVGSRAEVDALIAKAAAAGGKVLGEPRDYGFMYSHGYEDLDGHTWDVFYMDMSAMPQQ